MAGRERVVVAMSGGVDSSVAAALLVEQGYEVVGISMRLVEAPACGPVSGCCSIDDFLDARHVAARLGIPHYVVDYAKPFRETVVAAFLAEYQAGRTPLPCALCNSELKFDALLKRAQALGARWLATGHYVRVTHGPEGSALRRGLDPTKDQSYFMFGMPRRVLEHLLFPVGDLEKVRVRVMAEEMGLKTAHKPDSQELCFVPDGDVAAAVERLGGEAPAPGEIVDRAGKVLGRHPGIHHYTVGQRKGLGLNSTIPLYVVQIRPEENQVVAGPVEELDERELVAAGVNWLVEPRDGLRAQVRIRHRNEPTEATLKLEGDAVRVSFDAPKRGIAPGQAAVFYDGDRVLGGGWIQ